MADQPLDFCLLTSSLSSVLGGLGYAAYAGANLFMDAFVRHQHRKGQTHWISVNWDQWQSGDPVGDTANAGSALGGFAMTPLEGPAAFDHILAMVDLTPQVVVSTGHLLLRYELWVKLKILQQKSKPSDATTSRHPRPAELEDSFVAPQTETERMLAEVWQEVLGLDRIGTRDNFFDLGGHSLAAVQVIAKFEQRSGLRLNVEDFILQTLGQLAAACQEKLDHQAATPPKASGKKKLFQRR